MPPNAAPTSCTVEHAGSYVVHVCMLAQGGYKAACSETSGPGIRGTELSIGNTLRFALCKCV